jgi:hypothetical protein
MINQDRVLKPYYQSDENEFKKLKNNVVYFVEIKQPRNIEHHKKIFAITNCVLFNLPELSIWRDKTPYALIKAIEMELGYVDQRILLNGDAYFEPQSISFESMNQLEFQEFYDKAIPILASMINVEVDELESNSVEFM